MSFEILGSRLLAASIESLVVLVALGVVLRRSHLPARLEAAVWLIAMTAPVLTLAGLSPVDVAASWLPNTRATASVEEYVEKSVDDSFSRETETTRHDGASSWIEAAVWAWAIGVVISLLRSVRRRIDTIRVARASRFAPVSVRRVLRRVRGSMRSPRIRVTDELETPALTGIFAPTILLPASLASGTDDDDLASIMRHELAHFDRRDLTVDLMRDLVTCLFFFHPLIRWAGRRWEDATEMIADKTAADGGTSRRDYASLLLRIAEHCRPRVSVGGAIPMVRSRLGRRVAVLVDDPSASDAGRFSGILAIVIALSSATSRLAPTEAAVERSSETDGQSHEILIVGDRRIDLYGAGGRLLSVTETRDGLVRSADLSEPREDWADWVGDAVDEVERFMRKPDRPGIGGN